MTAQTDLRSGCPSLAASSLITLEKDILGTTSRPVLLCSFLIPLNTPRSCLRLVILEGLGVEWFRGGLGVSGSLSWHPGS